eukprot:TRINITY_DN3224_c0_g1_i1.p1 TRINITY_DN3224_c0_g1~~TRINITY_DN3224_c0_g1_i1.p1  ORF type:complete len:639 (-),score=171.16 TRINITY_DN3224_c0_g1_i1:59-1975(-)
MASSKEFKTRDDWRKEKQLDEARKAGTAAPLQDEDGRDINPHIPQYIAQAPWYLQRENPSLKHQRSTLGSQVDGVHSWYARGATAGTASRKFRKGACTNCGAMTHTVKDCCERPRAVGAKFSGSDIKADEVIQSFRFDYEGKHDRWNGYDPEMHRGVMERFEKTDELRRKAKADAVETKFKKGEEGGLAGGDKTADSDSSDSEAEDGEGDKKDYEDSSSVLHSKDPRTRTTIRNLRIREDTAKYLRNLAIDSALYDPKTRSMRENPTPNVDANDAVYSGDNFVRRTGDYVTFGQAQQFAWQAYDKGQEVHLQASPSQAELMYSQFKGKKQELVDLQKEAVLKRYGGEEHLVTPGSVPLGIVQTDHYVEYARDGRVLKGQDASKLVARSKYEENIYPRNHTSVWGSFWENGQWGFSCCKQLVRNAYCTGEAGRLARESILQEMRDQLSSAAAAAASAASGTSTTAPTTTTAATPAALTPRGEKTAEEKEADEAARKERLRVAILEEERKAGAYVEKDERKRGYNSRDAHNAHDVTEEEIEAYRLTRQRTEDPMHAFLEKTRKNQAESEEDEDKEKKAGRGGGSSSRFEEKKKQKKRQGPTLHSSDSSSDSDSDSNTAKSAQKKKKRKDRKQRNKRRRKD